MLFRLLFSFQRPSRLLATDSTPYLNSFQLSRKSFQFPVACFWSKAKALNYKRTTL
jgi:hypothetical protein